MKRDGGESDGVRGMVGGRRRKGMVGGWWVGGWGERERDDGGGEG